MKKWISVVAVVPVLAGCQSLGMGSMGVPGFTSSAFNQYDEDGDGVISRNEAQEAPALANKFQRLDTNSSGGIDSGEFDAASTNIAGLDFKQVDVNGDGVISEREANAMPDSLKSAFSTVDADGDGNISPTEYRAANVNMLEPLQFSQVDRDGDGVIGPSEAERVPALNEIYSQVDTDDDGQISRAEFRAAAR